MPKDNNLNILHTIKKKGFTLIELLVVMAIIGILIGVTIVGINLGFRGQRNDTRQRDLSAIQALLISYYGAHKVYPSNTQMTANAPSTTEFMVDANNKVTLSQPGLQPLLTFALSSASSAGDQCKTSLSTAHASDTTPSQWWIEYGVDTNAQVYALCSTQEGSDVYNVSSN